MKTRVKIINGINESESGYVDSYITVSERNYASPIVKAVVITKKEFVLVNLSDLEPIKEAHTEADKKLQEFIIR